jgi:hypothetical protein
MLVTGAQVAVQRLAGPPAERQAPLTAALAEHQEHVEVEIDVGELEVGHLGAAGAGVQQQHQQRGVAAGLGGVATPC